MGAAQTVERVLHEVGVDAARGERTEDALAHLVTLVARGGEDDDRGAVAFARPGADVGYAHLFGEQGQRRGECAVAANDASVLAGGAPGDGNGGRRIGVGDAGGKRGQERLVAPAVGEQLRPARHYSDQQVEGVGRGGGADNPD